MGTGRGRGRAAKRAPAARHPTVRGKRSMARTSRKVVYAALAGNGLLAVSKFVAAALTGSAAMLSEGFHSVVDTGNQVLLLHGIRQSRKPADERFPFGRGKEVYFWSFVVAVLLFAVGAGLSVYEGVSHLREPSPAADPAASYAVLGLAVLFEGASWHVARKEFARTRGGRGYIESVHREKDPTTFVVLLEDSAALLGIFVAFAGVLLTDVTGKPYYDGAASLVIGLILGGTAAWLAYETKGLLIGESAYPQVVQGIRDIARSLPHVEHVNEILTIHMGPAFILVNISVVFADHISSGDVEEAVSRLDGRIKREYPDVKRVFIEAEGWKSAKLPQGGSGPAR